MRISKNSTQESSIILGQNYERENILRFHKSYRLYLTQHNSTKLSE